MAITCNNCSYSYNDDNATSCSICNYPFTTTNSLPGPANTPTASNTEFTPSSQTAIYDTENTNITNNSSTIIHVPQENHGTSLSGRISHIERFDEKIPMGIYEVMSKILLGILILVPYATIFMLSGLLSFSFAMIGFQSLSQLFNPVIWTTSVFELLELFLLRRFRGGDTVPIYRGMIENRSGQESSFLFRGPLRSGNLVVGHNVTLNGEWQRGEFASSAGTDQSTRSQITSRHRNPWQVVFFVTFGVHILIGLCAFLNWHKIIGILP